MEELYHSPGNLHDTKQAGVAVLHIARRKLEDMDVAIIGLVKLFSSAFLHLSAQRLVHN